MMNEKLLGGQDRQDWKELFRFFDRDGNGVITRRSLENISKEMGEDGPTDEQMSLMFRECGRSIDGSLSEDDFFDLMRRIEKIELSERLHGHKSPVGIGLSRS